MINLREAFNLASTALMKPWIFTKWQSKRIFINVLKSRFLILCSVATALPFALTAFKHTHTAINNVPSIMLWAIVVIAWFSFGLGIVSMHHDLQYRENRKIRKKEMLERKKEREKEILALRKKLKR
jgi:hypothetical protein